jgi:hypothetical protein
MYLLLNIKRLFALILVSVIVLSGLGIFIFRGEVGAISSLASDYGLSVSDGKVQINEDDVRLTWISARDIEIVFVNSNSPPLLARLENLDRRNDYGETLSMKIQGWECDSNIRFTQPAFGNNPDNALIRSVEFDVDFKIDSRGACGDTDPGKPSFDVESPENSVAYFRRLDEKTIERVDSAGQGPFIQDSSYPNTFIRTGEDTDDGCQDRVILYANNTMKFFELDSKYSGDTPSDETGTSCNYNTSGAPSSNFIMNVLDPENASTPEGQGTPADAGALATQGDASPTCETASANPISWIMCPILNGILVGIDAIFTGFIVPFLKVSPINTDPENTIFIIWSTFRTIGNIVLLFALLFAVFGQAIGGGMVDAYTVKKIMPRILVAAILINLSIYIVAFMIDVGNILGQGIGQLITAPLGDESIFNFTLGAGTSGLLLTGGIFAIFGGIPALVLSIAGVAAVGVAGVGSLLSAALIILLPAILIVLGVFVTLILRQGIIMLLTIISPIAMALWAVPGADKYTKSWFNNLVKAILVYPIAVAIFAISDVMAFLLFNGGVENAAVGGNTLAQLAGIIVLIAPMAMIPFAFKLAGGLMAGVSSFAMNSRGKVDKAIRGEKHDPHSRYYTTKQRLHSARSGGKDAEGNFIAGSDAKTRDAWRSTFGNVATRLRGRGASGPTANVEGLPSGTATPPWGAPTSPIMPPPPTPGSPLPPPTVPRTGGPLPPPTPGTLPPPTGPSAGPWAPPTGTLPFPNISTPSTNRPVTSPTEHRIGDKVVSRKGNKGEVVRFADDGNPIVKYDGSGNKVAYTKADELTTLKPSSGTPMQETSESTKNNNALTPTNEDRYSPHDTGTNLKPPETPPYLPPPKPSNTTPPDKNGSPEK